MGNDSFFQLEHVLRAAGAAFTQTGMAAATIVGTQVTRTSASTNRVTQTWRRGVTTTATAGALAGVRTAQIVMSGRPGGYEFYTVFAPSDAAAVTGERSFHGVMASSAAPTNVEPTTLLNCIGLARISTSTNFHFIRNDATGAATAVDLGATFPANQLSTNLYEMYLKVDATSAFYQVTNLSTAAVASNTVTTDLPASTLFMAYNSWVTNNAQLLVAGYDLAIAAFRCKF